MRIDFQQGIITYPTSTGQQVFLAKTGSFVSLQTANGRTDVTFAHGSENYLHTEASDVINAWGPLLPNTDYWLYWDINMLTAVRTFGTTQLQPIFSSGISAGKQTITFSTLTSGANPTNLVPSTTYTANIIIDGTTRVVTVLGSLAQTFSTLLAEINNDLSSHGTATLDIANKQIRITSGSSGISSSVSITGGTLFAPPLATFVSIDIASQGTNEPLGTTDQHWFNTATQKMYVYQSGGWREVVRVFAAKINNNTFTGVGTGVVGKPFAGSQVGLVSPGLTAGRIVVDNTGTPIRRASGQFFTTEDDFFVNGSPVNVIRLEANIINGTARENIARYQVVKFTQFGRINLATYNDTQETVIAMAMEDMLINQTGTLCVQGVITNPDWNFQTVGVPVWIDGYGLLTQTNPHVTDPLAHPTDKVPVGRVLTPTSIYFDQGLGGKGERGPGGDQIDLATDVVFGISRLSVPAVHPLDPIVVGDNDPRLIPYVHPATHPASMITTDVYGMLTGPNAQVQFQQLADRSLDSLGDVSVTTPVTNDFLRWTGTTWVNSPGIRYLNDLLDVTLDLPTSSLASGDVLVYNSTTQQWTSSTNQAIDLNGQSLKGSNIINYCEQTIDTPIVSNVINIDYAFGGVYYCLLTNNITTINILNSSTTAPWINGRAYSITFIVQQDTTGGRTITWAGESFKWDSMVGVPTVTASANAIDVYTFITINGGNTWLSFVSGKNMS
ncbi:MAG: hypothetical protein CTY12_04655 [Methylotenera sp.]|nr:MAG: hypothetical protein CTY12_04655 [Methylotenera sp.]